MSYEQGIVNRSKSAMFGYQAWPTICKDENGVIYCVSSAFRTQHICPFGKTAMYKSFDNGKSWTPPIVINDTWLDDRDAGICYMGNGRMIVTFFCHSADAYHNKYYDEICQKAWCRERAATIGMIGGMYPFLSEKEGRGGSFYIVSEDYGNTWSDPKRIPISAPHGPNICSDGRVVYMGTKMYADEGELPEGVRLAVFTSYDGGYTFEYTGAVNTPPDMDEDYFCEPHIIELPNGRLVGAIRQSIYGVKPVHKDVYITFSDDKGKTWTDPKPLHVDGAPPHLMLHSSGALVCTFGRRLPPFGERAVVSYDGGETWSDQYILFDNASNPDLGYPSSVELPDGRILTAYYQKYEGDSKCSVLQTIWEL